MSNDEFVLVDGLLTDAVDLNISKAKELAVALTNGVTNWARLIECRRRDSINPQRSAEIIVFEVEVEVPQRKVNDVRRVERLAPIFSQEDNWYPEVLALRSSFQRV